MVATGASPWYQAPHNTDLSLGEARRADSFSSVMEFNTIPSTSGNGTACPCINRPLRGLYRLRAPFPTGLRPWLT
jgi:hypothetical protein